MKKCILIYEDDDEISELCKLLISTANRKVVTLARCTNVVADIQKYFPDLILMDLWIPEIGGEKAIILIKENPDICHIPVVVFSANNNIEAISKKVKANAFLKKPFDISVMKQLIDKLLL
ncbi:response regulator [Arachidicoccus sp.]|jgi:DNA-binding NtrC family response regulator|uniref:response regulator n=1 Tax=Arachidicoccus sp. TaxID=1872624 RepID=UPI003D1B4F54